MINSRGWHIPRLNCSNGDDCTSSNVDQRQPKNCVELAPPTVSDDCANDAEKVDKSGEAVVKNCGDLLGESKLIREVQAEDGWKKFIREFRNVRDSSHLQLTSHAIIVESFAELVADNERNSTWILQFFLTLFGIAIHGARRYLYKQKVDINQSILPEAKCEH